MIAVALGISVRTVYKWLARYRNGGMAALETRSSAPARPAKAIDKWSQDTAARLRRTYRMSGAEIADRLRLARSTVPRCFFCFTRVFHWPQPAGVRRLPHPS